MVLAPARTVDGSGATSAVAGARRCQATTPATTTAVPNATTRMRLRERPAVDGVCSQSVRVFFSLRAGETIPRHELIGEETDVGERTIDVQINRLRRKIEDDPTNPVWLQTVRGIGYRLSTD